MPKKWSCMEVWRATPEVLDMPDEERRKYAKEHMTFSSDGPFPDGTFDKKAPISIVESAQVLMFFFFVMGTPLGLGASWLYTLLRGTRNGAVGLLAFTAFLCFHPLPKNKTKVRFTLLLYKYFSYRFMWVDDSLDELFALKEKGPGWVGAGCPHGVIPLANFLCMPGINTFTPECFVGAGASVVLYTPGLRYLSIFGDLYDVSAKTLIKHTAKKSSVGICPDGIAGIFQQGAGALSEERVALKTRQGLARLSLRNGIPIVPAYSLGNTAVFSCWHDPFGIMERLSRVLRMSIFAFWGRWGLPIPYRANITMIFGPPYVPRASDVGDSPSKEAIDKAHETILDGIATCFNQHKGACGWKDRVIKFV